MHIINLTPLEKGVYNDHKADHITAPPDGWAYIPDGFPLPSTFPRLGSLEAEEKTYTREVELRKEVTRERNTGMLDDEGNAIMETYTEIETVTEEREYTMMTVTAMTEGTLPEPEPEPGPTIDERVTSLQAQLAETDEAAIELYEASMKQEAVNAEQDEAIIEIYERIGGMTNG